MKLISGLRGEKARHVAAADSAEDHAIAGRMRAAAVELRAEGRRRLRLPKQTLEEIRRIGDAAAMLHAGFADDCEAFERLVQDAGLMCACAEQARLDCAADLPAADGKTRIERVVAALCGEGELRLTKERLLLGIASFDDVQTLEMAELWAVPQAVRVCMSKSFLVVAREIMEIAGERRLAQRWADGARVNLSRRSPAFFEHALRLLSEREEGRRHALLERQMTENGISPQQIVQQAHGQESLLRMRLENIVSNKRLIDALNWQACFEMLSPVEQELNYDPAGVYPAMEEDSCAAVRAEVSVLARRLSLSELTVARHAVRAAQLSTEEAKNTVCFWLYSDEGRRELVRRMGGAGVVVPRIVPDPTGRWSVAIIAAMAAALFGLYLSAVRNAWLAPIGIPLAWCAAMAILGRMFPLWVKPAKLLKMKIESVPDELRTLVVMPVLLSDAARAEEICRQFEALGSLEKDRNIGWLILGDFADGEAAHADGDDEIVACVRQRIAQMNDRAGRRQYFYLHRGRQLLECDHRWMGRDRKRGALMDLNRLLLGETGAEDAFSAEGEACGALAGKFAYVLTLDADTRFLPGAVQRLIGVMSHPLNHTVKGYAVLQPQMEMMASACVNGFVRLFAGNGGVNTYPGSVSGYWQDVTGTGLFGGKGLYDVRKFHAALDGALPEGKILSHDLIEGTLAGAAQVSDVAFYDGYPPALGSFLKRLHRWTRGDWQLLPMLLSRRKYPVRERSLTAAERLRLLDNLLRSLWAPMLTALLILAVWMGNEGALAAGLLLAFLTSVLHPTDVMLWRRTLAELTVLPAVAACTADAAVRTLWRLTVSKKHLLDWVTSADAEKSAAGPGPACGIAALLMLPGVFVPDMLPAALALGVLFFAGPGWMRELEGEAKAERLEPTDTEMFLDIARDTWKFFETYVSEEMNFLPPDNVQLDPDVGAALRTSPTNIGLYLLCCVSARKLGFIEESEFIRRVGQTVETIGRLEKWNGHLLNWYDIRTLEPMRPKYVSAVDSGNLAASLLLCAEVTEEKALSCTMRELAKKMDFSALYDPERRLFRIGVDAERGKASESHYDLLASEARILSYTAMMLGQVPVEHWKKLGRTAAATEAGVTLASWSGTMFEYLMSELFMHAPENTMLGCAMRTAVRTQCAHGRRRARPWGVSESGYCAFDLHLNYQYRAFGLRGLSLSGQVLEDVVAPYASALAAMIAPKAAAKNFRDMEALGWRGEMGFYEAADYLHASPGDAPRLVKSYMAHHQGMTLCALCNCLTERSLSCTFMKIPEAQGLALLLEERPLRAAKRGRREFDAGSAKRAAVKHDARTARPGERLVDAHLLGGAGATALVTADGMVHYMKNGVQATRFSGDFLNRSDGACVHICGERTGECKILAGKMIFSPGGVAARCSIGPIECEMQIGISPEDGTLIKRISMKNTSESEETVHVMDCVPVALDRFEDQQAHPVFRHLFVESERVARHALMFRRRPRQEGEHMPVLMHMVSASGSISCETDYERLVGRSGSTMRPGGVRWELSDTVGAVLNPCSALKVIVSVAPQETVEMHFAMCLMEREEVKPWIERNVPESMAERGLQLSGMQAKSMLGFLGLDAQKAALLCRLSALMFDGSLAVPKDTGREEAQPCRRETLWSVGISGDAPILMLHVTDAEQMKNVREIVRAHEYYRTLGIIADLVLVDEYGCDYAQPVRDALQEVIEFSHLNALREAKGGVHLLEGAMLNEEQRTALHRAAALDADAAQDFYAQVRTTLAALDIPQRRNRRMLTGEKRLMPMKQHDGSGIGGYLADGRYAIDVFGHHPVPAPWSNLMANERFGVLTTERGGGFIWYENSRSGRLTAFANDALNEGWGWMLYLVNEENGEFMPLLPGKEPGMMFRTVYGAAETLWRFETEKLSGELAMCVRTDVPELRLHLTLRSGQGGRYRLVGFVDWLMGTNLRDGAFVRTWHRDGACFAVGTMDAVGYFASANARVRTGCDRRTFLGRGGVQNPEGIGETELRSGGWTLDVPVELHAGIPDRSNWVIGAAKDAQTAYARVRAFYAQPDYEAVRSRAMDEWKGRRERLEIETPDKNVNRMANGWLLHQVISSRLRGRTGLYQPGGAFGFRDQLQDMLALLPSEPAIVRAHLLYCAERQFEDGDVMHWWHEPFHGVRTHISDDLLFLPYVTAQYVKRTQDTAVLSEEIAFLENTEILEGKEDVFAEMHPGETKGSLHEHCMRAFRRASAVGKHGLALMGGGDWNDGMNRVGIKGTGESVWLSEFLSVCAEEYASVAPDETDRVWLKDLSHSMKHAVEKYGWDGAWYLRAFMDDGTPLGSAQNEACRIDAISQAWAVVAGLDQARCAEAMESAWKMLADERTGIIKLLAPPFDEDGVDPGYIRSYPKGVRENGAQYTHGACWLLLALIRMGDADRVHRALKMLLPQNHADTPEKARAYRVEPYVMAADVYDGVHAGRGGWTWYTGSAAWMYVCILEMLGFERRGNAVRLCALLGDWPEAAIKIRHGGAQYRLVCRKDVREIVLDGEKNEGAWIELKDDGQSHEALFPPRIIPAVD